MRRTTIGILAVVLLVLWCATLFFGPGGSAASGFAGGCLRVGLVLAALWLALPQMTAAFKRLPNWMVGWLVRSDKPPGAGKAAASGNKPAVEQPRAKRPRRRSTSG